MVVESYIYQLRKDIGKNCYLFQHPAFLATKLESQTLSTTFEDLGIKPELLERLKELNIEYPTTIQAKAIPHMLQGL